MQKSLNEITAEDLKQCKELAAVLLTPVQISIILEINTMEFIMAIRDEESDVYKSFTAGRLQTIADVRGSVIKLAKAGSSPAQTMAMDMIKFSELKINER